jgi:hypothetical protein
VSLFYVHVTVNRDKFIKKQLDALISQIYFGMKLYMFRTVPLSIIRSFSLYIQLWYMSYRGTAVAQWLRYCVTNRKVAGSIPDGVVGIFH